MAEKIINNPSLLPDDLPSLLDIQLSGNNIIAISGHPVAGSGGGTQSDFVYYPVFDDTTGNVEFHLGTTASNPQPAGGWHISGATGPQGIQGEQGIQGIPGVDGKNPVFEIDSNNAHWKWKYAEATSGWTDLGIAASGSVGPKGEDGDDGTDGISPKVQINPQTNEWEVSEDGGTTWASTYVKATGPAGQNGTNGTNGKDGKDGTNGVSPTVSTSVIPSGNRVTFTYGEGSSTYIDVMNGASGAPGAKGEDGQKGTDGFSPTVTTSEISPTTQHPQGGTSVIITDSAGTHQFDVWNGLNGEGATVNLLEGTGIQITENGTDYIIGVSADYALKSELPDVTDMATKTWVENQGYLTSVPNTYALKTDVEAASANAYSEAVAQIPSVTDFITKDVNNLTYYYKKTETSSTSEITNALSTKLDSTVAEQTYQAKADMTNYLTTSDASTTYQPKGNYASASDISDMATQTWVGLQGFLKNTDLTDYATKTYANEASANALSEAETWVGQQGYLKTVPDITANNGLSATGHTVGISTTNIDANKQYAWTTTGWQLVSVPTIPDITAHNGLSADGHTVGIDDTNIAANTQYAWTTNGWAEVDGYLPTSGGTVSGQLVVSATQNTFDDNYIKCINNGNVGYSRFGVGSYGGAVIKTVDGNNNPVQVNVRYNANNNELIQVQKSNADVGYLIPAKIEQTGWTPSADDKILHIVLES